MMKLDDIKTLPGFSPEHLAIVKELLPFEVATVRFRDVSIKTVVGDPQDICVFGMMHGYEGLELLVYHPDPRLMGTYVPIEEVKYADATWDIESYLGHNRIRKTETRSVWKQIYDKVYNGIVGLVKPKPEIHIEDRAKFN